MLSNEPFASVVFGQDGDHALDRSQDGSVDDHRSLLVVSVRAVKRKWQRLSQLQTFRLFTSLQVASHMQLKYKIASTVVHSLTSG